MEFARGDTVKIKSIINKSINNKIGFVCEYDFNAFKKNVLRSESILAYVSSDSDLVREWDRRVKKLSNETLLYRVTIIDNLKICRTLLTERCKDEF